MTALKTIKQVILTSASGRNPHVHGSCNSSMRSNEAHNGQAAVRSP